MNKEKIKCLNFLLKFHSLNLDELEWNERVELATDLDYFIRNDTISNPKTIIKNLVILDTDDGFEFDETDSNRNLNPVVMMILLLTLR